MTAAAAQQGLTYRLDLARSGNTFDAHRLAPPGPRAARAGRAFFVIDRRSGVSGAQPADLLRAALVRAHDDAFVALPDGDGCVDGACAV